MSKRKKIPNKVEIEIFKKCRRRCCVCYGLKRDKDIKKGQIAHLDHNPSNNEIDNLAFLCLLHHDEYDSKRRQSRGLSLAEVKSYKKELEDHFRTWQFSRKDTELLNFLASMINLETMADVASKIASLYVYYGPQLAFQALTVEESESCDMDLYIPLLLTLDYFQSWGWLSYTSEKITDKHDIEIMRIKIKHEPVCKEIAKILSSRIEKGEGKEENRK